MISGTGECIESETGCRRCRDGTCARCAVLLYQGTCVHTCPPGFVADWSTRDEYMGRICRETGYIFGLTGSQVAILVGVFSGATICIFIILCGAIVVHRRKKKAAKLAQQFEDRSIFILLFHQCCPCRRFIKCFSIYAFQRGKERISETSSHTSWRSPYLPRDAQRH